MLEAGESLGASSLRVPVVSAVVLQNGARTQHLRTPVRLLYAFPLGTRVPVREGSNSSSGQRPAGNQSVPIGTFTLQNSSTNESSGGDANGTEFRAFCSFWLWAQQMNETENVGRWSQTGCWLASTAIDNSSDSFLCLCNHLTYFSLFFVRRFCSLVYST